MRRDSKEIGKMLQANKRQKRRREGKFYLEVNIKHSRKERNRNKEQAEKK